MRSRISSAYASVQMLFARVSPRFTADAPGLTSSEIILHRERDVYNRIFIRLLPFLILCYFFAFVDRTNVAFAKLQFTRELGFSEAVYGLGSGIFYFGYSLFEFPSNLILARIGIRKTLLRIMIVWGICSALTAFIVLPWHYYTVRFLLGAAEAGFFPGILFYLTLWVPERRRAHLTSLFMAAIPFSGIVGGPLSGWLMTSFDGVLGLQGWQWLFLIEGLPPIFLGIAAYFYLDDTPATAKWLTSREKEVVARDLAEEARAKSGPKSGLFSGVLRTSGFYALVVMACAVFIGTGGITFWLPTIIRSAGVTNLLEVGLLSALPYLVGLVVQILVARHSDKTGDRKYHVAVASAIAGISWCALPSVSTSPILTIAVVTIAAAGVFGATATFWTMSAGMMSARAGAGGIALVTSVGALASFGSPSIVGWLSTATGSLAAGHYFIGAAMFVGALAVVLGVSKSHTL